MNTTLSYALDDILTYKLDIKAAINAKGGDAGDTLSYYATAISNLPTSSQRVQWPDGATCQNSAPSVDWSQFDTSNVTQMQNMFAACDTSNMTNLSYFDTSSATNMSSMFSNFSVNGCINEYDEQTGDLISSYLPFDLSQFDTSNVEFMNSMFDYCQYLTYLDVSSFNTYNVTNMSGMFNTCNYLTHLDLSTFNTHNVTTMNSMFSNCGRLTYLNVSSFNTSNVTDMNSMFANCNSLTYLDVSSFDMSNVTDMAGMFSNLTATLINLSNANFATDDTCNTGVMFYLDWYDESTQTQHTWSNITRTVVLDNVSNDVFNYLTKNTCPASEYSADYENNSNSIAPNWIIHRDGNVYEYDDANRQWSVTGQVPTPEPEPEPTQPYFTSPIDGDLITGTIDSGTPEITCPIELEYGDETPIPYDITSQHVTCDNSDITIGHTDDGQSISSVYMSINQAIGVGTATLTYEDPDTGDTCTVTFDYDISGGQSEPSGLDVIMMSGNEVEWQSPSITDLIEVTDPNQDDPETGEPPLRVTGDCTFSCGDSNIAINGVEITASAPGVYEIIAQDNNTGRVGSVIWTITEGAHEV